MTTKDPEEARNKLFTHLRQEIRDDRVVDAMMQVPRELFVPEALRRMAYDDIALPIKLGQTISQPLIVAVMTQALELTGEEKVLEVGTGSGYQAAVLSHLAKEVISVERHLQLINEARSILASLGCDNVQVRLAHTDSLGYPEEAPYDAIIVTAAAPMVPHSLTEQLKDGGRCVIPVGTRHEQELVVATRVGDKITRKSLGGCRFVPLIGQEAWEESA
ncbi:MAG: protein-L-isoaspartate(D-aspartate) O-methyltransferase [Dehalococcoidia bacterium]|nr:protein-L-isoaspartate(D-aspartate) O-methyltransferase [Dehalococcoidia bacterium]